MAKKINIPRCSSCVYFKKNYPLTNMVGSRRRASVCTYGLFATPKHGNSKACQLYH